MVLTKIKNSDIKEIINICAANDFDVKAKDVAFVCLMMIIDDKETCWKSIFTTDKSNAAEYVKSDFYAFLKHKIEEKVNAKEYVDGDISFEENKQQIIELINETKNAQIRGEIDIKDALKIQADLRCKLNDKFNVSDTSDNQLIIVENKFNAVCPYCKHEVSLQKI